MKISKLVDISIKQNARDRKRNLTRCLKPQILLVSNQFKRLFGRNFKHFLGGKFSQDISISGVKFIGWEFELEYRTGNGITRSATLGICIRDGRVYFKFTGPFSEEKCKSEPESRFNLGNTTEAHRCNRILLAREIAEFFDI